jgi:uncharacterized protein YndB with AHSA1/START domain
MDWQGIGAADALRVRLQRRIEAPAARVWGIIASAEGMGQWLGPKTFEPRLDGRVLFDVLHGARADGVPQRWLMFGSVVVFDPERELAFTWQEFNVNDLTVWPTATVVAVGLEAQPGGAATLVTLSHTGFEALPNAQEEYAGYAQGWASLNDLEQLARMCEAGQ